jgi:putative ABC transport system permease protein
LRLSKSLALSCRLLAAHKLRTGLSVSGLGIGVAAVMVMVALGRGAEARVLDRIQAMGTDLLIVSASPAPRVAGRPRASESVTLLRPSDADVLVRESPYALRAAPSVSRAVRVRWQERNVPTLLTGITPQGLDIRNIGVARGRAFDEEDEVQRSRVALVGPTAARTLFGTLDPVGLEVRIGQVPFTVIGVTHPRGTDVGGADQDDVVLIPLATALRRVLNLSYVNTILVQGRSSAELERLEADVQEILTGLHPPRAGAPEAFRLQNQTRLLRMEGEAARSLTLLVVGVAGLAFGVGGIGILSVMLMSVRERMREVGLRRALGARKRDVQIQFVMEAGLIALAGGAAGAVVGALVAGASALVGPWDMRISWWAALAAVAASCAVGIGAGMIPAWRASNMEPVEALLGRARG